MTTSAIFVDFDNVFGGLFALDPVSARQMAQNPELWMRNLTARHRADDQSRSWLVRRCYMNPAGWVLENGERLYLSRFRPFFARAGFEVVDCPPLTRQSKNAADIRIVIDALDVLGSDTRPDEFIIASSDSDFTPLLHRIRSRASRIMLITLGDAVSAYKSLADQVLDAPTFLELLADEPDEPIAAPATAPHESPSPEVTEERRIEAQQAFTRFVTERYDAADEPINLARFSLEARQQIGDVVAATNWLGTGSFTQALRRIDLPGLTFSQHYVWDARRHEPPLGSEVGTGLPDTISQVVSVTDLPKLDSDSWPAVYAGLAEYAATHTFNLTESTKWTRDRLSALGQPVGRSVIAFAMQGSMLGGAPLSSDPPPSAEQIASAFLGAVSYRAKTAGLILDDDQRGELRQWLHAPDADPADRADD